MTFGQRIIVAIYKLGFAVAGFLPDRLANWLPRPVGVVWALLSRRKAAMLGRHMRRAMPAATDSELRVAVKSGFESYVRYYVESFRLPKQTSEQVDAGFRVIGYGHIEAALAEGNGVILALPHLGGWEWAGFWLTQVKGVESKKAPRFDEVPAALDTGPSRRSGTADAISATSPNLSEPDPMMNAARADINSPITVRTSALTPAR